MSDTIYKYFKVDGNTVKCQEYLVFLKVLKSRDFLNKPLCDDPENYFIEEHSFRNETEVRLFKSNFVNKHMLMSIQSTERLNNPYTWLEGIKLRTNDPCTEIAEIVKYGSKEAYEASLPEYTDEFMLDIDVRVAMLEMGITE